MAFRFYQHPAGVDAPSVTSLLGGVGEERLYNWRLRNALRFMYENDIQLSGRKDIDMVSRKSEICLSLKRTKENGYTYWLNSILQVSR